MKHFTAFLFLASLLHAGEAARYQSFVSVSLTSAAYKLTVQQPASGAKQLAFRTASVYCSVSCTATFYRNGTAATKSLDLPVALSPLAATSTATVYTDSDVGTGQTLSSWVIPAGATTTFDLTGLELRSAGTGNNFSVGISSITGTASVLLQWEEPQP